MTDFENGIATRVWSAGDPSEVLEAAGLSEQAMSQEDVQAVRDAFDAFESEGIDGLRRLAA